MAKEILIAASERAEREEFEKMFEPTGYRLVFSERGEDVLLRVKQLKPALIIAGNSDLCEAVKKDPASKDIPFILLASIFDEIPEGGPRRIPADGVISKPFYEDEVLNLVERLMGKSGTEWGDEEIIELVDVVEEPESRMNIDDFVGPDKEEPLGEILPLESWGKMEEEEAKPLETGPDFTFEKAEMGELKEDGTPKEETPKEAASDGDFFERIELDEILQQVDDLKPFFEKEWSEGAEVKVHEGELPQVTTREDLEPPFQKGMRTEAGTREIEPSGFGKPEAETRPAEIAVEEMDLEALAEEALETLPKEELTEEEFPEELLEEVINEEEISVAEGPEEIELKPEGIGLAPEEISLESEGIKLKGEDSWFEPEKRRAEFEEEKPFPMIAEEVPREIEKVISEGIREITEEFITKLVPQLTQNIIALTVERIEKMVREVVPDLAEKAIREEIERLEKGIKG